jgi:hypothetical protein
MPIVDASDLKASKLALGMVSKLLSSEHILQKPSAEILIIAP